MSAELVETSRLYARMNAAIDPEWAEKLAGDLCKRTYSEPHWEKAQGAVIGYERVTLYGVPIVVNRRIQFSRIDAAYCRELFIRHALVEGEWDSQQAFDRQNRALIKQLEAQAERARKPQLAPDDDDVYRFYEARIPAEVVSTRSFEGWWKKAKHEQPDLLNLTRADLLPDDTEQPSERDLPSQWQHNGQQLRLKYRFDPGAQDDGVTVEVPIPVLASLTSESFDWLVPGMRAELVATLIKSLPKVLRRNVVPAADWATKVVNALPAEPTGSLLTTVAHTLQQLSGTVITANDFDLTKLTDAQRMTYRVVDAGGKTLGMSTNLAALQEKLAEHNRGAVASAAERAGHDIERDGLTTWDFGELPPHLETKHAGNVVRAFPALVAVSSGQSPAVSANLRLFSTESEQRSHHALGVRALVQASVKSPAKYVEEHLTQPERLALAAAPYPSFSALIDDVISAHIDHCLRQQQPNGLILTQAGFEQLRATVQLGLMDAVFDTCAVLARVLGAARAAGKAISDTKAFAYLTVLAAERAHIEELLPSGFVSAVGLVRLPRLAVYLQAVEHRVRKLGDNPAREVAAQQEVDAALNLYRAAGGTIPLGLLASDKVVTARWMLEELRVSLFAQQLGTPEPVSVQRIKKALS